MDNITNNDPSLRVQFEYLPVELVVKIMSLLSYEECLNLRMSKKIFNKLFEQHRILMKGPTIICYLFCAETTVSFSIFNRRTNEWFEIEEMRWKMVCQNGLIQSCSVNALTVLTLPCLNIFYNVQIEDITYMGQRMNQFWWNCLFSQSTGYRQLNVSEWYDHHRFYGTLNSLTIFMPVRSLHPFFINCSHLRVLISIQACQEAVDILAATPSHSISINMWVFHLTDDGHIAAVPQMLEEFINQIYRICSNDLMSDVGPNGLIFQIV